MMSPTLIPSMPRSRKRRAATCTIRWCVACLSACECPIFSTSKMRCPVCPSAAPLARSLRRADYLASAGDLTIAVGCRVLVMRKATVGSRSGEQRRVLPDKCLDRHWRSAGQFLDEGIGAGENAFLVIDGNRQQMLREGVAKFCVGVQTFFKQVEIDRLILHRPTQRLAYLCRNLMVIHLDRPVQRIYLAHVRCRVE